MKYLKLLGGLACCLVFTSGAYAQEDVLRPGTTGGGASSSSSGRSSSSSRTPISIGVDLGVNYNMFSQNTDYLGAITYREVFESGSGFSPFFDAYLDVGLSRSIGVQLKLSYDMKNFSNSVENDELCPDPLGGSEMVTVDNDWDVTSVSYVGIAALLRVNITENFIATIGPTVHFAAGDPQNEIQRTILTPGTCLFTSTQSKEVAVTDTIDNALSTRVGLDMALGYKIPLTSSIDLLPKVGFQYFFSKFTEEEELPSGDMTDASTKLHSLQLSIGVLFGL